MAADINKEVSIIFTGKNELGGTLTSIETGLTRISGAANNVLDPLAGLSESVLKVEAALAAMAVGGLAYAVSKSIEYDNSVVELTKVLGDNVDQLDVAKAASIRLSETYGESAASILNSTADFKQAGFDVADALTLAEAAMKLVIIGGLESAEASGVLVRALKGFDEPASEAARLLDILNAVSNNYATDVRQLAIGMSDISPIAKQMGFSMEETAGLVTPIIEVFGNGSEAAIALKTGLLRLIDDSAPVGEALARLGVSQKDVNGQFRSGSEIFYDVAKAFGNMDENQKTFTANQLFGKDQAARLIVVFNELSKMLDITSVATNNAGNANQELAVRLASAEVQINKARQGFVNLAITIGDQFKVAAASAAGGVLAIEQALRAAVLSGMFDPVLKAINDFGGEITKLLNQVAKNLPDALEKIDWTVLLGSFDELGRALKGAFEALFGDIDLSTVEGLSKAIQGVVDAIAAITNVTSGIVVSLQPFLSALSDLAEYLVDVGEEGQVATGRVLGFAQGLTGALAVVSAFGIGLIGVKEVVFTLISGMSGLSSIFGGLASLLSSGGSAAAAFAGGTAAAAAGLVGLAGGAGTAVGYLAQKYIPVVGDAAQAIIGLADDVFDFTGTQAAANAGLDEASVALAIARARNESYGKSIADTGDESQTAADKSAKLLAQIDALSAGADIKPITIDVDEDSVKRARQFIEVELADGTKVFTSLDEYSARQTAEKIEKEIPSKREVEVEAKIELEKLKAQAEVVQNAIEWKAKLDIAEVEANAKITEAIAEGLAVSFSAAADAISAGFSVLAKFDSPTSNFREIVRLVEQELNIQQQLAIAQIELAAAQSEYLRAKAEAFSSGEPLIKITADGLEPELEAFMWQVLERIQVQASAEGAEFLLGMPVGT